MLAPTDYKEEIKTLQANLKTSQQSTTHLEAIARAAVPLIQDAHSSVIQKPIKRVTGKSEREPVAIYKFPTLTNFAPLNTNPATWTKSHHESTFQGSPHVFEGSEQ